MWEIKIETLYNKVLSEKLYQYYKFVLPIKFDNLTFADFYNYMIEAEKRLPLVHEIKHRLISKTEETKAFKNEFLNRIRHSFSVYLLGIYIYHRCPFFAEKINSFIETIRGENDDTVERDFKYIWFLITLFHDIGYAVELDSSLVDSDDFLNNLYERTTNQEDLITADIFNSVPSVLINNAYHYYQKKYEGRITTTRNGERHFDHAFISALLMKRKMRDLHVTHYEDVKHKHICSPEIFRRYILPVVNIVFCHNIWYAMDDEIKQAYRAPDVNLPDLCLSREEKDKYILFSKHPLSFFLDFIDTLDPYKWFQGDVEKVYFRKNSKDGSIFQIEIKNDKRIEQSSLEEKLDSKCKDLAFLEEYNFKVNLDSRNDRKILHFDFKHNCAG